MQDLAFIKNTLPPDLNHVFASCIKSLFLHANHAVNHVIYICIYIERDSQHDDRILYILAHAIRQFASVVRRKAASTSSASSSATISMLDMTDASTRRGTLHNEFWDLSTCTDSTVVFSSYVREIVGYSWFTKSRITNQEQKAHPNHDKSRRVTFPKIAT